MEENMNDTQFMDVSTEYIEKLNTTAESIQKYFKENNISRDVAYESMLVLIIGMGKKFCMSQEMLIENIKINWEHVE